MNYRNLAIVLFIILVSLNAFAFTGFNRYYYTDNYSQSNYYPNPSYANAYNYTQSYTTYNTVYSNPYSYYTYSSSPYYPTTYQTTYYSYPVTSYTTYISNPYQTVYYPTPVSSYRSLNIYSDGDSWGIGISTGSICGYYGYC